VFKTDVYRLCRWLNRDRELIPASTLEKPPSAELAPNQKDQDSLPPYEVLDAILRSYVEDMADPARIIEAGHDPATVERVVRLVVKSEYKRWQAPPGLRVSSRAFGMGRRLPLAQRWHLPGSGLL
jgi:NAD+ synthetase